MRPFRDLRVWQDSHQLTLDVHKLTRTFPREEVYALTSQMWRAAYSVPMNIAEGSARSDRKFHQALRVALGSATELEYQFLLAKDLGYITLPQHQELELAVVSVKRQLVTFMQKINVQGTNSQQPKASSQ